MKSNFFVSFLLIIITILLILQRFIEPYYSVFSYFEELVVFIFLISYILLTLKNGKIPKDTIKILILMIILICIGIYGNKTSGYERSNKIILSGIIVWFKAYLFFICAIPVLKEINLQTTIKWIGKISRIFVILSFITLLLSSYTNFGIEIGVERMRYGFSPFKFIYDRAAIFSWICIAIMMALTTDNLLQKHNKNFKYMILLSIIWIFTLRSRAFVYVVIYWILYFIIIKNNNKHLKIKPMYVLIIGILSLLIATPAIKKYFFDNTTSRSLLLTTGIDISKRFFPFGAGFGNFATSASYKDYSRLYYYYGFNKIYALSDNNGANELADCYWPAVLGEMGFLGLFFLIIMLLNIGKTLLKMTQNNKWGFLCIIFSIVTTLFSSIVTGVFSSDVIILYFLINCICCCVSQNLDLEKKGE